MTRTFWKQKAKILAVALAATVGVGGLATESKAFLINSGDLVLALYGNGTEYYQDLGSAATLLASGANTTIDLGLSSLNPLAAVTGSNPIQWSLVRATFGAGIPTNATFMNTTSQLNTAEIQVSGTNNAVGIANNNIRSWTSLISTVNAPLGNQLLLLASDPGSFTSTLGVSGTLGDSFEVGGQFGVLGNTLTILQGVQLNSVLSDVGRAVLMANGQLQICGGVNCIPAAVPLPAAAVLFASGLIGLVGIARRKVEGKRGRPFGTNLR